jgi:hypothetical protein
MTTHMSLRLPWHDRGWDGHVCDNPKANVYCTGEFGLIAHEIRQRKQPAEEEKIKRKLGILVSVLFPVVGVVARGYAAHGRTAA